MRVSTRIPRPRILRIDARDCPIEDNDDIAINIMYIHLEVEEVFGGNADGSVHSCTVLQQLYSFPGSLINASIC